MSFRGFIIAVIASFAVCCLSPSTASAADTLIVTKTSVAAERTTDRAFKATVTVSNLGEEVRLKPGATSIGNPDCTFTIDPDTVGPRQGTSVVVTLKSLCFSSTPRDAKPVKIQLDEGGKTPDIEISPPAAAKSPWYALYVGGAIAVFGALAFFRWCRHLHRLVAAQKVPSSGQKKTDYDKARKDGFSAVKALVNERWRQVKPPHEGGHSLGWAELRERTYGEADVVDNLAADWSLKDSWMATLTAVISAVVALFSSDKLFAAIGGDEPKGPVGVMAISGLIGVAVVAIAATLVKLIGKPVNQATVRGLLVANAVLFGAAVFEIVAITIAGGVALGAWKGVVKPVGLVCLGLFLVVLAIRYLSEALEQTLANGAPASGVPAIDLADFQTWTVPPVPPVSIKPEMTQPEVDAAKAAHAEAVKAAEEKRELLNQRIKTALGPWLAENAQATNKIGSAWAKTGIAYGEYDLGPGTKPLKRTKMLRRGVPSAQEESAASDQWRQQHQSTRRVGAALQ